MKVGNVYNLNPGRIIVESLHEIELSDITPTLARETGFSSVAELLKTTKHGSGETVYLVSFRYALT